MTEGTSGVQHIHIRDVVEPLDEMPFWSVLEVKVMSCIDGGIDCKVKLVGQHELDQQFATIDNPWLGKIVIQAAGF